jgi:hypothetical protein
MGGGEKQEMDFGLANLVDIFLKSPVSAEENDDVQKDDGESDEGPAAPLHVLMRDRDEHGKTCLFLLRSFQDTGPSTRSGQSGCWADQPLLRGRGKPRNSI